MKIAYIVPSLKNQGPIMVVKGLVNELITKNCEITVYYFDQLKDNMEFPCYTKQIAMDECIDFDSYDIVHSHCIRPDKYVNKWKKHIHKAKTITTLHQDTYRSFRYEHNILISTLLTYYWCHLQSHFDMVACISNQLKDIYLSKIKSRLTTIYNGCSIKIDNNFDSQITATIISKKKSNNIILGTYAYVTRRKGLDQIIKALPYLTNYIFVIIGEGPDIECLKIMAKQYNVSERVLFFPYQDNPCNYLQYFDIYVMPSYSEGFGLAMVEAALAKLPIVCSDIKSFHEIFPNNEVGFFTLSNITSLVNTIKNVYKNKEEYSKKSYNRCFHNFTTKVMAENYLKYYHEILKA